MVYFNTFSTKVFITPGKPIKFQDVYRGYKSI